MYRHPLSMMRLLILTSSLFCVTAASVETFEISDLLNGRRSEELKNILSTNGLLAVKLPESSSEVPTTALKGWCACHDLLLQEKATTSTILEDGITKRNTLATATVGTDPLPLPQDLPELCGAKTAKAMERVRDDVAMVSQAFIHALDRLLNKQSSYSDVLMTTKYGQKFTSVQSIVHKANNLEHFHVYSKNITTAPDQAASALNMHTDAGLFLAFVPAVNCHSVGQQRDTSFYVEGQEKTPLQFPENSVAIMLGAGAEHWLQTTLDLKATRHAVRMNPGESRAWYGMMSLVPETAIVQSLPERTFGDMKQSMAQGDTDVSIGCGRADMAELNRVSYANSRRRLQHVGDDAGVCNNVTNFFCWMSCLDIPNVENAESYINGGYSLYCLDASILATTGNQVSKAVEPCLIRTHNPSCQGSWQPTASGVEAAAIKVNVTLVDEPYCYGGTSMYMDGFHWWDSTCVIYLIPEWVLDTEAKLVGASVGTIFFGIALEFVIARRRNVMKGLSAGRKRLGMSALFYGFQLTMGYLIMLVIMTYSGPLFLCTILGVMGGHILFNAQDAIFKTKPAAKKDVYSVGELSTSVETEQSMKKIDTMSCCNGSGEKLEMNEEEPMSCCKENDDEIPEGFTPCCQNEL